YPLKTDSSQPRKESDCSKNSDAVAINTPKTSIDTSIPPQDTSPQRLVSLIDDSKSSTSNPLPVTIHQPTLQFVSRLPSRDPPYDQVNLTECEEIPKLVGPRSDKESSKFHFDPQMFLSLSTSCTNNASQKLVESFVIPQTATQYRFLIPRRHLLDLIIGS